MKLGNPASDVETAWHVPSGGVGEIDENGSFTATGSPGSYPDALRVTVEQKLGDEVITRTASVGVVITGTLAELEIHPALATITPGRVAHFGVTARDENGVPLSGLVVIWRVSDEAIGQIDAFGNFTAGASPGLYEDAIRAEVSQVLPRRR